MGRMAIHVLVLRLGIAACGVAVTGCHSLYLHNSDRAAIAASAKKNLDTVDVAAISKAEQDNLAKLLEEEVKALETRARLAGTLAVFDLTFSQQSVAAQYKQALDRMQDTLGIDDILPVKTRRECVLDQETARNSVARHIDRLTRAKVPGVPLACSADMPAAIKPPVGMPEEVQKDFVRRYQDFAANCKTLLRVCPSQGIADKLNDERARLAASLNTEQRLDKELADARRQYQAAVKANQDRSKAAGDTQKNLQSKAAELQKLIENLDTAPPSVANKVKTGALVELLTAAATGKSDSTDPDLAPALEIAKTIPALAQSIEVARAQQRTVPVSHLLIALNDLTIRAERDQRLRALDAEELSIVERKIDTVDAQGALWRQYNDQLCNLVLLAGGLKHPEQSCGIIKFTGELSDPKLTCTVEFSDSKTSPIPVKDCILARSWRSLFEDTLREPQARALNEAAAAYLHVRLVTYTSSTLEFRRIDVDQRRNVVSSEAALRQWKNLVSVPTDELAGYYAGGVKPAELADLIVKALGFSAIAIGAAQ